MPALIDQLPNLIAGRDAANSTDQLQQVVCAWSLSGEYGKGSRALYYILVAACVLARKSEWLRNACLAAALVIPASAAIHAIVLASLHIDDAVDLDIYGTFQFCAIAILTAPATVRLSKTYFNNPGRNVMFIWTMLMLAGLMSLAVEFFRTQPIPCTDDGTGQPLYRGLPFPYGNATCGMNCTSQNSPYSVMRTGAADNINVIPAPYRLTFGAATLIAAACCIPGILSMVSMWDKIMKANWAKQFGEKDVDEPISGTNGATVERMQTVNDMIRQLLSWVEIPVFGGAVIALIVVGELNFFSTPMDWDTDPIGNISQWSNIAASVFALIGSVYMLVAEGLDVSDKETTHTGSCSCMCHEHGSSRPNSLNGNTVTEIQQTSGDGTVPDVGVLKRVTSPTQVLTPTRTETYPDTDSLRQGLGIRTTDSNSTTGNRREGTKRAFKKFANSLGTVSQRRFDDYDFRHGEATRFPEIPGELQRNVRLRQIREQWGHQAGDEEDTSAGARGRSRTRAATFSASRAQSIGPPTPTTAVAPEAPAAAASQPPPSQAAGLSVLGLPTTSSPESTSEPVFPVRPLSDGEPETARRRSTIVTLHEGPNMPAIVLSSDDEPSEASLPAVESAGPPGGQPPP